MAVGAQMRTVSFFEPDFMDQTYLILFRYSATNGVLPIIVS
jgi:hypothetical protein